MADDKVLELGRHPATVGSVVSRLDRFVDRIQSITAIVQWDDDTYDVVLNAKPLRDLAFEKLVLDEYAMKALMEEGPR